jgi:TatD DNase family protein
MSDIYYTVDFGVNFANKKRYSDKLLDELLTVSYNEGVDKVVSISNSILESKRNIELSAKYENLHFTIGIHPHNAKQFRGKSDIDFIESNISNQKCFGIGECGLDYSRMFSTVVEQKMAFEAQIILAKKHNVKLYLHCREAFDDFVEILSKHAYYNGLVHCWTGTLEQAKILTKMGFRLGITGWIFDKRRNRDLLNTILDPEITLDMLVVETDAPFMPIYPAKESVPSDTAYIVEEIARIKKIDVVKCGQTLYNNSLKWLGLSLT